jgi:hypothetical protein
MKLSVASSDALGTVLPRQGLFPSVHAPSYRIAVIEGELQDTFSASETKINGAPEPRGYWIIQTPSASTLADQLAMMFWPQTGLPAVRNNTDAVYAYFSDTNRSTNSPWQEVLSTIQPIRAITADAPLEDTGDALRRERDISAQRKHAGLAAVARLAEMLDLSRPTILRMGGVPESTFYAWQKSPHSIIRTPTVSRLLRLQAQVAILDEALGRDRMRAWALSADRLNRLQGDETEFDRALAEAGRAMAEETRIRPRPAMRRTDYASSSLDAPDQPASDPSTWPGASKIVIEGTKQPE